MNDASISRDAVNAVFAATRSLPAVQSRSRDIMGGSGTITLVGGSEHLLDKLWNSADELENLWSRFSPDSDISRVNWAEGEPVAVHPKTVQLINAMREGYDLTGGAFDPTLLPDVLATGYSTSQVDPSRVTTLPASATSPGRLRDIVIAENMVTPPRGTTLDAGGIGKGLASDILAQEALGLGVAGVMVELGGDICVAGSAPDGHSWHLGIENPWDTEQHLQIVSLLRGGIVTSSQVKRRFGSGNNSSHHLIDPVTHRSALTEVQTVTVIAATAARAEVLTKRGFIGDSAEYLSWLPTVGAAGFLVLADSTTMETTNWGDYR